MLFTEANFNKFFKSQDTITVNGVKGKFTEATASAVKVQADTALEFAYTDITAVPELEQKVQEFTNHESKTEWVRHAEITTIDPYASLERWFTVQDDTNGLPMPGSPLLFALGEHNTPDRWCEFIRQQLRDSPLSAYLCLGTKDSPDGTFGPGETGYFWRANVPLRLDLGYLAPWKAEQVLHTADGQPATIAQVLDECVQPPEAGFGQRVIELALEDTISKTVVKKWPCVLDYTDDKDNLLSRIDAFVDSVKTHAPIHIRAEKNGDGKAIAAHKKDWSIQFMNTAKLKLTARQHSTLPINLGWLGLAPDAQDDDILPTMIGFEPASLGGGAHVWRSPGYLLADRDLAIGERLQAWVISEQDGHVVKSVTWTAEANTCNQADWSNAFLKAINDAPDAADGSKALSAGYLEQNGGLGVADTGSPDSEAFSRLDAVAKMELNRLWCFGEDCRLFSNAPFKANQVIAARVPDVSPPTGESIAIQVRDRTTQYLYETYLFSPTHPESATGGAKALCEHINQSRPQNGMLRAGVLGADGVTVVPEDARNALWIPQYSNLSVEMDTLTWRKHRSVSASSLKAKDVIQLIVQDSLCGVHLPGSPFIYSLEEEDTDPGECFRAFAEALQKSPLGKYVRAGNAASADALPTSSDCMIWVMMLPIKVFVVGPLDSGEKSECALTSADGRLLTFGDLYKDYRSGLSVTLTERWSGRALASCEWQADFSTAISEADWLKGLAAALTPLLDSAPFMTWSEEAQSIPSAVSSECTLWLPESADATCIVRPWRAPSLCTPQAPPALHPTLIFLQDKLVCEEAIVYAAHYLNDLKFSVDRIKFSHLTAWGAEVISDADVDKLGYCMRGDKYDNAPWATRSAVIHRVEEDALGHPYYNGLKYDDPRKAMASADLAALLASSMARSGQLPMPTDVWQMALPPDHWVDCESCNETRAVFSMRTHRYSNMLISTVTEILNQRINGDYKSAVSDSTMAAGIQALKTANLLSVDVNKIIECSDKAATEKAEEAFAGMGSDPYLFFNEQVYGFVKRGLTERGCSPQQAEAFAQQALRQTGQKFPNKEERGKIAIPHMKTALLHVNSNNLEHLNTLLSHHEIASAIKQENLDQLKNALIQHPFLYPCSLQLQLTADAYATGIRVGSSTSDFSPMVLAQSPLLPLRSKGRRSGGVSLYVPQNVHIPKDLKLFSASYVSASNIAPACTLPLSIDPPIVGTPFSPKDTLCADYTATLGSEVYDISGAIENGVDPKTGLFHAHCSVGVIRGLEGKGPEVDLTLHYSATRANESALGDGWAFRFSAYDNRQNRLTLSNGQTVTLTAENVSAAEGNKRLAINGITLTGANGSFDALTEITVVFPSGRSETLAKPDPHDGEEPSEHFKTVLVSKLDHIKANLSQWLKESGISSEHTADYEGKIKNIEKMQTDLHRQAFILVPVSIESPLGGKLTLAWAGSKGHVRLTSIADGDTTLLSASHEEPVAIGKYSSTFTVWPDSDEAYDVKLTIEDCLLTHLTHKGQLEATPVQSVVFGYQREPVLDRVLCSVGEQDGSLEVVSYVPEWRNWDTNETTIPLSRVGRHTLVPGAGQQSISHAWRYEGHIDQLRDDGDTYSAICMQDNGGSKRAPFTRRTWTLKNGFLVQTQVIEELPGVARETTTMTYPDTITAADPAVKYRLTAPDDTVIKWAYQGLSHVPIKVCMKPTSGTELQLGEQTLHGDGNRGDDMATRTVGRPGSKQVTTFNANGVQRPDGTLVFSERSADGGVTSWYAQGKQPGAQKTLLSSFSYNGVTQAMHAEKPAEGVINPDIISCTSWSPLLLGQTWNRRTVRRVQQLESCTRSMRSHVESTCHASGVVSRSWQDAQKRRSRVRRGQLDYQYSYTAHGAPEKTIIHDRRSGRTLSVSYSYDYFERETQRTYCLDGEEKSRYELRWSVIGQLQRKTWYRNGSAEATRTETFKYDEKRNELELWTVAASKGFEIQDTHARSLKDQAYTYDALGNITSCISTFADGDSEMRAYAYEDALQPTQRTSVSVTPTPKGGKAGKTTTLKLSSNSNGSITTDEQRRVLAYTAEGQLLSVSKNAQSTPLVTYEYDEYGRLASQWDGHKKQRYVFQYTGDRLCGEVCLDGNGDLLRRRTLDEEAGLVVLRYDHRDDNEVASTHFNLPDPLNAGAEEYSIDKTGKWSSVSVGFTPWGEAPLEQLGTLSSGLGYNGQRVDPVTGSYHLGNGYRVYDPRYQAFLQSDTLSPFGEGGLNDRAYCAGRDPVNWHDPSGHIMISRRAESTQLASLDDMIRDTKPPYHEPAAWWEWVLAAGFFALAVVGSVLTGGLLGVVFFAIAAAAFSLSIADMSLRQSNPALSRKLGWASAAVGLFDASGKGLAKLGSLLLKGVRRGIQGLHALRQSIKLSRLKGLFKFSRAYKYPIGNVARKTTAAIAHLDNGVSAGSMRTVTLGGHIESPHSVVLSNNPEHTAKIWVAHDDYNVKAALKQNVLLMQESSDNVSKTIKQCEELIAISGKTAPQTAATELQNALENLKVTQKKLTDTQVKTLDTSASLVDADTLYRDADEAKQLFMPTVERWNLLKRVVLTGQNFSIEDQIINLKKFFKEYTVQPANIALLDRHLFKGKAIAAVVTDADKIISSKSKTLHKSLLSANKKLMSVQNQIRPLMMDLIAMKHELDADIRILYRQLTSLNHTLKGTSVYANVIARFDKLTHSIAACRFQVSEPLYRLKLMFHGTAPHSANNPNPGARAVIQTAPPLPGTSAPLKSYWDAQTTVDQLRRLKDPLGNPVIDFHSVDVVQLNMCHGGAGGNQSFAAEFSRIIGKPVKANTYVQAVNYSVDTIEELARADYLLSNTRMTALSEQYTAAFNTASYFRSSKLPPNPKLHNITYDAHWYFPPGSRGPKTHQELKQLMGS